MNMDTDKAAFIADQILDASPNSEGEALRRWQALQASFAAKIYIPALSELREAMRRPVIVVTSIGEARRLSNQKHDAYGRAFDYACRAVLEDPDASEAAKEAAAWALRTFLPNRGELNLDTASEITNARRRSPEVAPNVDKLRRVPAADGRSAEDLLVGQYATAELRARQVDDHASTPQAPGRDPALWARTWSLLLEFRQAAARERANNPNLPADFDTLVFGLLDTL